jgi:hypothetical protein
MLKFMSGIKYTYINRIAIKKSIDSLGKNKK